MNLFHETENKYYELIAYMLAQKKDFSIKDVNDLIARELSGERDFEVENALFVKKEGKDTVFSYKNGFYRPTLDLPLPIRNNLVELEAIKSLEQLPYSKHFLSENTINKLKYASEHIQESWNLNDIEIKNQYKNGATSSDNVYEGDLRLIASAINEKKAIRYDNIIKEGLKYVDSEAIPVKIEYSFINDNFRISAFELIEERFIKMNLSSMKNIRLSERVRESIVHEYSEYISANMKKILIDVDPVDHVIERCFRIFSFYYRKAVFDKEENKYKLEIHYLKFDEKELIRDILSLGSSVIVIEPKRIQKELLKRLRRARDNYL